MARKTVKRGQRAVTVKKSTIPARTGPAATGTSILEAPLFLVILILAVTFIAFRPSLNNSFIPTWDDSKYVTDNPMIRHLDMASVNQMFTTPVNGTYVPLVLVSYALEYHVFGLDPNAFHGTNLVLHLICTLLVFFLLRHLKLEPLYAAFGALLFGIHPMHVESVAWITERKDLLYTLFYLCSLILYIRFVRQKRHSWIFFALSLVFFVLSLFSKIQAVTLPLSLFLVDYLMERPLKFRLILEKVPYLALSLVIGIIGILFIVKKMDVQTVNASHTLIPRLLAGVYALSVYLFRFFVPVRLSASYGDPLFYGQSAPLLSLIFLAVLAGIAFMVYRSAKYTRSVVFGSLFFLFNIMFMLQVFTVGHAYLADRFSYIPYIGLIFIAGWVFEKTAPAVKGRKFMAVAGMTVIVILFAMMANDRCKVWENDDTLWADAIAKYADRSAMANNNQGLLCENSGRTEQALTDYSRAVEIDPDYATAFYNLGNIQVKLRHLEDALKSYSNAIGIRPRYIQAIYNRGVTYMTLNKLDSAVIDFSKTLTMDSAFMNARENREIALRLLKSPKRR